MRGPINPRATGLGSVSDPVRRVGRELLDDRLDERCRALLERLRKECPDLAQPPPPPGRVAAVLPLEAGMLRQLLVAAAAPAGSGNDEPAPVVWTDGDSQLLVDVARLDVDLGDGQVTVVIPVSCDQTQETKVTVVFAVGRPDRPAGLLTTTHERPSGPPLIIDRWGEALVALAWSALLAATIGLSSASGADDDGDPLVPAGITASANGLEVHTMATPRLPSRAPTTRPGRVP